MIKNEQNILIVDDTPENVQLLKSILRKSDATILSAFSGKEALNLVKDKSISLALIDILMPEMDGYELAKKINAERKNEKTPVIFLTAFNSDEFQILKGYNAGAVDYIIKPFNKHVLNSKINVYLELFRQKEELKAKQAFNYAVFENNPIPAILVDNEGRIFDWNTAQKKFSNKAMTIGLIMYKDYAAKHKTDMYRELMNCIETNVIKDFPEVKYKNKYLSIKIAPLVDGAIITCIDITASKRVELKLEKTRQQLEMLNKYQIDAREEERHNISMAIHDELGQAMTALKIDLNWLRKNLDYKSDCTKKLDNMIGTVNDIIKRVQRISAELRPGILDDLGLVSAIEWYCKEFEERTGIVCELKLDESIPKNTQIELSLYRIFQETLTNVIRHANAHKLIIH
ncbi:MAG: response regulator, partial [Bacteroidales bacterium]|nr:response regulator [Bacteroidales bacterium]